MGQCHESLPVHSAKLVSRPVFPKVGGIALLGAIFMSKGLKKTKGAIWGSNNTKGAKMLNR